MNYRKNKRPIVKLANRRSPLEQPLTEADVRRIEWKVKMCKATPEETLALFWRNNP